MIDHRTKESEAMSERALLFFMGLDGLYLYI